MQPYLLESAVLALVFEAVTLIGRFGFKQAAKSWTWNRPFGVRIHHGYWAPLLWLLAWGALPPDLARYAVILANGLLVSDVAHHLLLFALTGDPEL